ncbi:MAG: NEAT domain-containing protein [Peptostreptococcaceae bacterium]
MALRKRSLKLAVTTMALITVIASSVGANHKVYADTNTTTTSIERSLEDQRYVVQNEIEYIKDGQVSTNGYDKLRAALSKETVIEVKDNKIYMTLEFAKPETNDQYSMIENISISVDGKATAFEKRDDRKYTLELDSLESKIQLTYDVVIPIPGMPAHSFTMNVLLDSVDLEEKNEAPVISASDASIYVGDTFDAISAATANDKEDGNLTSSIKIVSNNVDTTKAGSYNVTYEVTDSKGTTTTKTITVTVKEKEIVKPNGLEDGKYTIKNKTVYSGTSSMGTSMVRNSLEEVSYVEVKNGEVYVTLEFSKDLQEFMKDIKITADGAVTNPTVDGTKYTFKVESINSNIEVSAYITAMGMNINYNVELEESSIEKLSSSDDNSSNGSTSGDSSSNDSSSNGSTSGDSSSNNSSSNDSSSNSSSSTESTVKKGKLYTIQNTVDHESETGKQMARKYLNSTSKVELIDGQYYVTLTFTGSEFMQNHAIYVNGSKVSHTVTSKSGDTISLRFKVSSLSDSIKVGMYVVPMSKDIKFTVTLLEDTLTFVKDYEISTENGTTLPQTGSILDTTMGVGAGSALMAVGGLLNRRKRSGL